MCIFSIIGSFAQNSPYLQLDIRSNFLSQKIDFLDGPRNVPRSEVEYLMAQSSPEAAEFYQKARRQEKWDTLFAVAGLGTTVASIAYIFIPEQQSSQQSNLFLPLALTSLGLEIVSGVFRRNARNTMREAVDAYNMNRNSAPVYFEDKINVQPILSYKWHF